MGAFRLPKETEEEQTKRNAAIHVATLNAARVPLKVAKDSVKVMDLALKCAREANINAVSDSMSGFAMARAALTAAGYNVKVNLNSLSDKSVGEKMIEELKEIESKADELEKEIRKTVSERGGI
jgi:formiminotetrahydrofolate cyclodeaminase